MRQASNFPLRSVAGTLLVLGLVLATGARAATEMVFKSHATLRVEYGGNFSALGLGQRGYLLGGHTTYAARNNVPASYAVTFPSGYSNAWTGDASSVNQYPLLVPPGGQRRSNAWYAGSSLSIKVTVPQSTNVTFYLFDFDSELRRYSVRVNGTTSLQIDRTMSGGIYATFTQPTGETTYDFVLTQGANVVVSGVLFDDPVETLASLFTTTIALNQTTTTATTTAMSTTATSTAAPSNVTTTAVVGNVTTTTNTNATTTTQGTARVPPSTTLSPAGPTTAAPSPSVAWSPGFVLLVSALTSTMCAFAAL